MKTNIATTKDQSDRLLRCGVSADTADMCYDSGALSLMDYDSAVHERDSRRESYEVIPAWSLSALLGLLPKKIDDEYKSRLYTFIIKYEHTFPDSPWQIKYESARLSKSPLFFAKDPIEACVKAIEWLTENNYKLNEINKEEL